MGPNRMPGDLQLGQGPGPRINPFGLNYTPEEFFEKQVQEIKHCRLAMLGAFGLYCQCANSGLDIKAQIGGALTMPDYAGKAYTSSPKESKKIYINLMTDEYTLCIQCLVLF